MFERLRANKNAFIQIYFEQHDNRIEHRRQEIEEIVSRLVCEIQLQDRREFPVQPKVNSASKEEICLVVAGIMWLQYLETMKQVGAVSQNPGKHATSKESELKFE